MAIWKPTKKNYSNDVDYSNEIKKSIAAGDYAGAEKYERVPRIMLTAFGIGATAAVIFSTVTAFFPRVVL